MSNIAKKTRKKASDNNNKENNSILMGVSFLHFYCQTLLKTFSLIAADFMSDYVLLLRQGDDVSGSRGMMFSIHVGNRLGHVLSNCGSHIYLSEVRPIPLKQETEPNMY